MTNDEQFDSKLRELKTIYEQRNLSYDTLKKKHEDLTNRYEDLKTESRSTFECNQQIKAENLELCSKNKSLEVEVEKLKKWLHSTKQKSKEKTDAWKRHYQANAIVTCSLPCKKASDTFFNAQSPVLSVEGDETSLVPMTEQFTEFQDASTPVLVEDTQSFDFNTSFVVKPTVLFKNEEPQNDDSFVRPLTPEKLPRLNYTEDTSDDDELLDQKSPGLASKRSPTTRISDHDKENQVPKNLNDSGFYKNLKKVVDTTSTTKTSEKGYKYAEVVRKKADREQLDGFTCAECAAFYKSDNLSEEDLKRVLKNCSKHRHKFAPPPETQPEFWEIDFPNTQQYMKKGYMLNENVPLPEHAKPKWQKCANAPNKKRCKYL